MVLMMSLKVMIVKDHSDANVAHKPKAFEAHLQVVRSKSSYVFQQDENGQISLDETQRVPKRTTRRSSTLADAPQESVPLIVVHTDGLTTEAASMKQATGHCLYVRKAHLLRCFVDGCKYPRQVSNIPEDCRGSNHL